MGLWDLLSGGAKKLQQFTSERRQKIERYKAELEYKDSYELREIARSDWSDFEKKYAALQLLKDRGEDNE
jgi:hypothetical protein